MVYLEIVGAIIGFIYLWLEYKASIKIWIVGIIMPTIYIFIYLKAGLYADFGMNIYYLLAAIYGYIGWKYGFKIRRKAKETEDRPISKMPGRYYIPLAIIFILLWWLIAYILINTTDSNVPIADSFVNALSIIAMWMLAKKYVEQWIPWIVVDAFSIGLYIYKDLYPTSILYAVYTIVAFAGYLKWRSALNKNTEI